MFIVKLTHIVNASNHTKLVSLDNQKCEVQPFAVKIDKCVAICRTRSDLSNKACVPNKAEDLNIHVFNMITGKNESKILTKRYTM